MIEWLADGLMRHLQDLNDTDETRILKDRLSQITKEKDNILKAIRAGTLEVLLQALQADYEKLAAKYTDKSGKLS